MQFCVFRVSRQQCRVQYHRFHARNNHVDRKNRISDDRVREIAPVTSGYYYTPIIFVRIADTFRASVFTRVPCFDFEKVNRGLVYTTFLPIFLYSPDGIEDIHACILPQGFLPFRPSTSNIPAISRHRENFLLCFVFLFSPSCERLCILARGGIIVPSDFTEYHSRVDSRMTDGKLRSHACVICFSIRVNVVLFFL